MISRDPDGRVRVQMVTVLRHIEVEGALLQLERVRDCGQRHSRYLVTLQRAGGVYDILDEAPDLRSAERVWWQERFALYA